MSDTAIGPYKLCPFCGGSMRLVANPEHSRRKSDCPTARITHSNVDCPLADLQFHPDEWNRRTPARIDALLADAPDAIPVPRHVLQKAAYLISSDYCSHGGECGPSNKYCYADFIYQAMQAPVAAAGGDSEEN